MLTIQKKQYLRDTIKPKTYQMYGIFDFELEKLIYTSLDCDVVETEFDLQEYNESRYDIVEFEIQLV